MTLADAATVAGRSDPQRATEAMHDVSRTGRQALGDMRRLLGLLRDGEVKSTTVGSVASDPVTFAPQPGLAELEGVVERVRSTGLTVSLTQSGTPFALSAAAELTVFRIVQEALTNAMKHADSARSVAISLAFDDPEVRLLVTDDGRPSASSPNGATATGQGRDGSGHGVLGMSERAAAFDGSLVAGPRPDGGWQVAVTLRGCRAPALL